MLIAGSLGKNFSIQLFYSLSKSHCFCLLQFVVVLNRNRNGHLALLELLQAHKNLEIFFNSIDILLRKYGLCQTTCSMKHPARAEATAKSMGFLAARENLNMLFMVQEQEVN